VRIAAVIVGAGRGARASRGGRLPKQYVSLNGVTVFRRTLDVFVASRCAGLVQAVIHADDGEAFSAAAAGLGSAVLSPVTGGATRQASVLAGLRALVPHRPDLVLVHDAARPFVDADVIDRVVLALSGYDGVVPGLALADTLKSVGPDGVVARTIPRDGLWRAQTPQGFRFGALLAAHTAAECRGRDDFTDDAALAEDAGLTVGVVEGSARNRKLTTAEDLDVAEDELSRAERWPDVRTGTGFDVHRFAAGDHVWLGGVRIAHTHRLDGHSDADVVLHALTDALLGAIGDGDIGQHFPPSDPQWKGAASRIFLEDAVRRVGARGGRISNVDMTVLCEAPRIGPHRDAMRETIAGLLGIAIDRVGVKATTTEQLGFTGRREGIAAMATATVLLPG